MIRILIIEDNNALAEHYKHCLALAWGSDNVRTTICNNYPQAIAAITSPESSYDLIHLDLNLTPQARDGIGDGTELINQLTTRPHLAPIPIIVVTGYAEQSDAVQLEAALDRIQFHDKRHLTDLQYVAAVRRAIADPAGFIVATKKGLNPVTNCGPLEIRWHEYKCFWNDIFFESTPGERRVLRELCCTAYATPRPVALSRLMLCVPRGSRPERVIETHIANIRLKLDIAGIEVPPQFIWDKTNDTWFMQFP